MNEHMTGPVDTTGPQRAPEQVIVRLRPHARRVFFPNLLLPVIVGAASWGTFTVDELWQVFAVLAAAVGLVLLFWAVPMVRWLNTRYTLTTRRMIIQRGLLARHRTELLHSRGYDVAVRQAGLQVLFRSGDVLINTGLDRPVILRDVPSARLVQSALSDLMEAATSSVAAQRRRESAEPPTGSFRRDRA